MNYLHELPDFILYFSVALSLFAASVALYVRVTPYREFELIAGGNVAAASALVGTMVGLALPLASAVAHSVNPLDMVQWAAVAMVSQVALYLLMARVMPQLRQGVSSGNVAAGVLLGGISLCTGVLNAACMTY